jgi:FkbM family methyltransferase
MLRRLFTGYGPGFYVDVGAGHPRFENDTYALYEAGWRGINIEPNEDFFRALQEMRPGDRNLCVALSDKAEGELFYHEIAGTGLSTCDPKQARIHARRGRQVRLRCVPVSTLALVLEEACASEIDVLKVDVEGLEEQVLAGNDWDRFRPRVVLVEATFPESPERRPTAVRAFLETRGYRHAYFDGLNDFFLEQSFNAFRAFAVPPNVFDDFVLREVRDLRAEAGVLREEFRSAQGYLLSLEAARTAEGLEHKKLATECDRLRTQIAINEAALTETNARAGVLEERLRATEIHVKAQEALIIEAERRAEEHNLTCREVAALEAALTTVLRSGCPSSLRLIASNRLPNLLPRHSKGHEMDVSDRLAQCAKIADADTPGLATRLAAAQIEGLQTENRRLGLDLDDLRAENRRLRAATEQMRAEILVLSRALEPMHRLHEELASWRAERSYVYEMKPPESIEQLTNHLRAIYTSSSWRLTRPWRALGRLLRGQRGGDWPGPR